MIQVKILKEDKIPEFYNFFSEVLNEGFPEYSSDLVQFFLTVDFSIEKIKKWVHEDTYEILIAEEENNMVGFLFFEHQYGGVSYCTWLGVKKEMRGKGIGKMLIEKWEELAKKKKLHKLLMMTQSQTNRMIFPKYGFKEEGHEEKSWFGLDSYIFGKLIGEPNPQIF